MHGTLPLQPEQAANHYGVMNHFLIPNVLKETAHRYGLNINQQEFGKFSVSSGHGAEALHALIEPFYSGDRRQNHIELDRKTLQSFLKFLHQPIANTVDKNDRALGHNLLRFLTTGHVEIPAFVDEDLQDAKSLECHEKGERKMKEDDVWALEPELWNPEEGSVSSIPGTSYDPKTGFHLTLDPSHLSQNGFTGPAQQNLKKVIWQLVSQSTNGRIQDQSAGSVSFTAAELQECLSLSANVENLEKLVQAVQIEEKAQAKISNILKQADKLRTDPRFQIVTAARQSTVSVSEKMDNLSYAASSCLSPILKAAELFETWTLSNFTERLMGLSDPVNSTLEEYAVMKMVIDQMAADHKTTSADLQAMVNHFRPLFSFSMELAESIEHAPAHKKKKFEKQHGQGALVELSDKMSDLQTAFEQASVNGVAAGELQSDHEEIIEAVKNVFGQNGNVLTQNAVGYVKMMKEFWVSAAQSAGDNLAVFGAITGFVGYAWWTKYGADAQLAVQAAEPLINNSFGGNFFDSGLSSTQTSQGLSPEFLQSFKEAGEKAVQQAIESGEVDECIIRDDCHYNKLLPEFVMDGLDSSVSQYLQFRHWVGKDIIASNAMTAQSFLPSAIDGLYGVTGIPVDENSTFLNTSEVVTNLGGEVVVDANMWQDGSHAAMLGYGATRIAQRGPRGFQQMTGLAAEFINPSARMLTGALGTSKRIALKTTATSLMLTGRYDAAQKVGQYIKTPLNERLMAQYINATNDNYSFALDETEPKYAELDIDAVACDQGLWAYGFVSEKITVNSQNIQALNLALKELALTLSYSSEDIGITQKTHKDFLSGKLQVIEDAIQSYLDAPEKNNALMLKAALNDNLQHIIGAELKYADNEKIYNIAFPDGSDNTHARRKGLLKRTASKREGRFIRTEYRNTKTAEIQNTQNQYTAPEKLLSLHSLKYAWGATSSTMEKGRLHALRSLSYPWGMAVFVAREGIQEPIAQLPYKKALAGTIAAGSAIALPLDMVAGIDYSLVNTFSAVGATVTSITSTGLIAAAINLPQDLGLHTAAVYSSGLALGLPWYYAVSKGFKPSVQAMAEQAVAVKSKIQNSLNL